MHYGYTTSISDADITLRNCEFKRNRCDSGYGGAVAFNIDHDLTITDCLFEDNHASSKGGAIYFWSRIEKPADNPSAPNFDGTIKIGTISITNCQFKGNDASDGHAIAIDEYHSLINAKLVVTGCTFTDNGNAANSYIINANIAEIDFQTNTIQYTDTSKSTGILSNSNPNLKSVKLVNCDFTNCYCSQTNSISIEPLNDNSLLSILDCNFNNCKTSGHIIKYIGGNAEIDSCTVQYDNIKFASGAIELECYGLKLQNSNFFKTNAEGAVKFTQKSSQEAKSVLIEKCLFDGCAGSDARCFDISILNLNDFIFRDTVFQNLHESGEHGYFVGINCNHQSTLLLDNITFQNNRCNAFYGGGSGIWFTDVDTIKFANCKFLNNIALKSPIPRDSPPTEATEADYYSGDGGGIQFGYSNEIYNANMVFENCEFTGNRAVRHGAALALQTVKDVTITGCRFKNNIANYDPKSSSKLLEYGNHYSKKTYGRGGAIYLNPAFSHVNKKGDDESLHMLRVQISGNNFEDNSAYDGYAIYIQGEDPGTQFDIKENTFKDNYDKVNDNSDQKTQENSVILSEIPNIELPTTNTFVYSNLNENLKPSDIAFGSPEDTEDDGPDYFDVVNVTSHGRNDYIVTDTTSKMIISIILSRFHDIRSTEDGGALYIVNAGLACNDITFYNCSSSTRGGAIFIHNTFETTNYGNVIRCNITDCSAKVGGGVFIFSKNLEYRVTVRYCTFTGNSATAEASEELHGGSGAYIVARRGKVKENTFIDNVGYGNALKLSNNIHKDIKLTDSKFEGKLIVSKNKFVVSDLSDNSALFYTRGKGGPLIELRDCIFEGKLKKGRHFIEGETISNEAQKLIVKNCKFEGDASNAVQLDSDFLSIKLNENHFDSVAAGIEKKQNLNKSPRMKSAFAVVVAVAAVSVIAVVGFVIFFVKKVNPNDEDDNEMSFDA